MLAYSYLCSQGAGRGGGPKRGLASFFADALAGLADASGDFFVSRLLVVQSLASFTVGGTGPVLFVRCKAASASAASR